MTVKFYSTPQKDMRLYAGLILEDNEFESDSRLTGLIGKARDNSLASLKADCEKHRNSLKFTFHQYVHLVENNKSYLFDSNTDDKVKIAVSMKLKELAQDRIQEERAMNFLSLFFHKIGQLINGHGFQTFGMYGMQIVNSLSQTSLDEIKKCLKNNFEHDFDGKYTNRDFLVARINQLSSESFTIVLNEVFFTTIEKVPLIAEKPYLLQKLSAEKREQLLNELYARKDWFRQALNLMEYEPELVKKFIDDRFLEKALMTGIPQVQPQNDREQKLYDIMIPRLIGKLLKIGDFQRIKSYLIFFQKPHYMDSQHLSEEEKKELHENISKKLLFPFST